MFEQDIEIIDRDKLIIVARLTGDEEAVKNRCEVSLQIAWEGKVFKSRSGDYCDVLQKIRKEIEPLGFMVNCYGGSRNCYPSGMSRDMSLGTRVYRLKLREHARIKSLVEIFDSGPDLDLATVEEQDAFYRAWCESPKPKYEESEKDGGSELMGKQIERAMAAQAPKAKPPSIFGRLFQMLFRRRKR